MTKKIVLVGIVSAIMIFGTLGFNESVFAGNHNNNPSTGGIPQGKPFQNLQANIGEVESNLQAQIDGLQSRINDLETQIADLAGNLALEIQARIDAINGLQNQLDQHEADDEVAIANLSSQIDDNRNALADLLIQTGNNADDIAALLLQLEAAQDDIADLEQDLADLEAQLAAELASKQNLISGICPDGEAAVQVLEDGTLVCGEVASAGVSIVTVEKFPFITKHNHPFNHCHAFLTDLEIICTVNHTHNDFISHFSRFTAVFCPAGSEVTGGGFRFVDSHIINSEPFVFGGESGWSVVHSGDDPHDFYVVSARCLSVP